MPLYIKINQSLSKKSLQNIRHNGGRYIRQNPDLVISFIFAVISTLMVPFSLVAIWNSVNVSLLGILFCLMVIISGLRHYGILTISYSRLFSGITSLRNVVRFLVFSCFIFSMIVTNDVALIIFVPLAIKILHEIQMERYLIFVVTFQTIAANMGSILTPIGNPQNLFIYSYYQMSLWHFLQVTAPIVVVSGFLLYGASFCVPMFSVTMPSNPIPAINKKIVGSLIFLLFLCILTVLRIFPLEILILLVCPVIFYIDHLLFLDVDYKLLLLFMFLFIGVGNLGRLPFIADTAEHLLVHHEFAISLLLSQFLSNVPTAIMLAHYTGHTDALLEGVNIGGLGTIVASMASLISFRAYMNVKNSQGCNYLLFFTGANFTFLLSLLLFLYIVRS